MSEFFIFASLLSSPLIGSGIFGLWIAFYNYEALVENNRVISADALIDVLKGRTERPKMLMEIFQHHNNQLKALVGKEFSPATLERYKTSLDHTRSFLQWKHKVTDIAISSLEYEFITPCEPQQCY